MPTRVDALVAAQDRAVHAVRTRVLEFATALWAATPNLRDKEVAALTRRLIPVVQAGQMQVAQLTNAYIAGIARAEGIPLKTPAVDRDAILGYRGVPAQTVYERPAVTVYTKLAAGMPFEKAKAAGLARLVSITSTDLQQAHTRQAQATRGRGSFRGFRRVLTGRENCALCVIASTQRYHHGGLLPIHPGCDCGEKPFVQKYDRQVIDQGLLDSTHQTIIDKLGDSDLTARDLGLGKFTQDNLSDYTELIVTREHGELGPTLAWRTDHFTTAADLGL